MPLWNVHHPAGVYTEEEKQDFVERVTSIYESGGLPRFYVAVLFHEVGPETCYVGGEEAGDFVRITVAHLARHFEAPEDRARIRRKLNDAIEPFAAGKNMRWEFHVEETPPDLWMINGLVPPPPRSEAEKLWVKENRAIPY